jgi:hypothetical protein
MSWPRFVCATLFLFAAAFEVARALGRAPWPGLEATHSHVAGIVLAILWGSAAFVVTARAGGALRIVPMLGAFAFLPHGIISRAGGARLAIIYIVAAPVMAVLTWLALGGRLRLGSRSQSVPAPTPRRSTEARHPPDGSGD